MEILLVTILLGCLLYGNINIVCYIIASFIVFGLVDIDHVTILILLGLFAYCNLGLMGAIYVLISLIMCFVCMGIFLFGPYDINILRMLCPDSLKQMWICVNIKLFYNKLCKMAESSFWAIIEIIKIFRTTTNNIIILEQLYMLFDICCSHIQQIFKCTQQIKNVCGMATSFMSGNAIKQTQNKKTGQHLDKLIGSIVRDLQ